MRVYIAGSTSLAILALTACSPAEAPAETAEAASFEAALERHVAAVPARNIADLEATITTGDKLMLIFPDGERLETPEEYLAFHREWFADPAWSFQMDKIESSVTGTYGHALYRSTFDPDADGPAEPSSSFVTIGFRLEDGEWRLVHDQNTRIIAPESE